MTTKTAMQKLGDYIGAPQFQRRRWQLFVVVLIITVTCDLLVSKDHGDSLEQWPWEALPGWNALFGFLSCLLIIFISKFLGHYCGLMRDEDYYDD